MSNLFSRIKNIFFKCIENLQQKPRVFILLILLNLPYVMQHVFELLRTPDNPLEIIRSIASAFLRTVFFAFLLDLLLKSVPLSLIRQGLQAIVIGLSSILFLLDVFALWCYRCVVDKGMLVVLFATNPREALEFTEMFVLGESYALWCAGMLLLLVLSWFILLRLSMHKTVLLILILASFACSLKFALYLPQYSSLARYGKMLMRIGDEKRAYDEMTARLGTKEITLTKNESSIPYVIFILGESTSRNHMGLYGYQLPTTPRLGSRAGTDGFYIFRDVISHHTHTSEVLEELFTFCRHKAPGHWFDYENVFDIVKAAGYHTAWLSNQESFGIWGNVANHYANRCDYTKYTMFRDSGNDRSSQYDDALLPLLDTWLQKTSGKNFCVIHLLGTHYEYRYRYPASFNTFSAKDESGENTRERRLRAEYDNAILYNDFIVDEIIRRFEDKNAILIYVSDHAENVYDEPGLEAGHDEINANRYMAEIPMIIWTSPSFQAAHPGLEQRIAASAERPFMTDDMIHVLLDIMEIETKDYDPAKSVINEQFDTSRIRIYGGKEYKKEIKGADAK